MEQNADKLMGRIPPKNTEGQVEVRVNTQTEG